MPQVLTEEEERLVEAFILLPLAKKTLERDQKAIRASLLKFKEPYILAVEQMLFQISRYLYRVKREAGRKNMRFYKRSDLEYTVFVRGWRFEKRYHPQIAAEWVKNLINHYFFKLR
ncbi:hypothetical protein BpJC7_16350 [Weizmannia acidilactici]|uniref:Uncharacterized protein n=1 Tax=Weizmannia acidilactici TaxID=2607726 RepID=A0A5J4J5V3_9BACI|nr:hypothetical protein [Weizmannia acidilactici]GER67091.1 hypothetical protein BpJC4_15620 [Weizmannia acidilactici]GER70332.1 hypothetical protein BpJC7_16350 [Weizmannia acidilactici]GER73577.1 hypothetical protein BpPP18_16440 [Weizmannia acidilactici]